MTDEREHAVPASPSLWRHRDFTLLWSGNWVSYFGSRMSFVCYPLVALAITGGSATAAGLAGFAAVVPSLLLELLAGAMVDRWDRRRVLAICAVGRALVLGALTAALLTGRLTLPWLLAAIVVEVTLFLVAMLAERAAVRLIVPDDRLRDAVTQNEARARVAALAGTPLGTVVFTWSRWGPFLAAAVGGLAAAVTVALIRTPCRAGAPGPLHGVGREIAEGVAWVARHGFLRAVIVIGALGGLLLQLLGLGLVVILVREQGYPESLVGLVVGLGGAGGVVGALVAARCVRAFRLSTLFVGGHAVWAAMIVLMAWVRDPVVLGGLFAAMSFVQAVFNVVAGVFQTTMTPPRLQGRIAACAGLVITGATGAGSLLGGVLLDAAPGRAVLLGAGAAMAALALAAALVPSIRRFRLEPAGPGRGADTEPSSSAAS